MSKKLKRSVGKHGNGEWLDLDKCPVCSDPKDYNSITTGELEHIVRHLRRIAAKKRSWRVATNIKIKKIEFINGTTIVTAEADMKEFKGVDFQ